MCHKSQKKIFSRHLTNFSFLFAVMRAFALYQTIPYAPLKLHKMRKFMSCLDSPARVIEMFSHLPIG